MPNEPDPRIDIAAAFYCVLFGQKYGDSLFSRMTTSPAWKRYQEEACAFFLALGLDAQANVDIQGVRAVHAIDVYVTYMRFGIQHRWLVECKFWQTAVPKEKVLAFQSILLDIGADKGFLLSESGFQAGAVRAAAFTNILLASLETIKSEAQEELRCIGLDERLRTYDELRAKLHGFDDPLPIDLLDRYVNDRDRAFDQARVQPLFAATL